MQQAAWLPAARVAAGELEEHAFIISDYHRARPPGLDRLLGHAEARGVVSHLAEKRTAVRGSAGRDLND